MSSTYRAGQFFFVICVPISAYAGSGITIESQGPNAIYTPPIVREATVEWPEPDPEAGYYRQNDPDYYEDDSPSETVISTEMKNGHHFIEVAFTGPLDTRIETQLMLDTGATIIALPASMMEELDIAEEDTVPQYMRTANGAAQALISVLPLLEIGDQKIHDVDVAFLPDTRFSVTKLLGMGAIKDYKMTIDNQNETVTLVKVE